MAIFIPSNPGSTVDQYFSSTVLIACDENEPDGTLIYLDTSSYGHAITPVGAPVWSQASVPAGLASGAVLRGSPWDALTVADAPEFDFAAGDFTIEAWALINAVNATGMIVSKRQGADDNPPSGNSWELHYFTDGVNGMRVQFGASSTGNKNDITGVGVGWQLNVYGDSAPRTWAHYAVCRSGNTWTGYFNGVQGFSHSSSATIAATTTPICIGGRNSGTFPLTGGVASLRLTKGVARYTSNFTPPGLPLIPGHQKIAVPTTALLHFDGANGSTTFTDSSVFNHTFSAIGNAQLTTTNPEFGSACLLSDGSGDGVHSSSDQNFAFWIGDFTVEGWVNFAGTTGTQTIVDFRPSGAGNNGLLRMTGGAFDFFANGLSRINGGTPTIGAWVFVSLCRASNVTRLFIGGTQVGSSYTDTNTYAIGPACFASGDTGGSSFNGTMDEWHILKGQALRTSNFTPPTSPFTP